ncbi:hypothetical protein HPB48_026770 [Haemaphysalis longicornis]|uniref:Uncharacterized protein n=1 Tax=Haemaphysalis longicornis TaxID=44386 RepID=A0A9J6HD67_HAELO|nr:hypothetical protein HPB48_026770 [Haemaphysalis longicornis]
MPTNAELCKRVELLGSAFDQKLNDVVDKVVPAVRERIAGEACSEDADIKTEIEEFHRSLSFMNELLEKLKKENDSLKATNQSLTSRNSIVEKRFSEMEQYSRKSNVEIKVVPSTKGESCVAIVKTIGGKTEFLVSESDLDIVHRVLSKADTPHIIVWFCSRANNAEFLSKARKACLQTKDLGIHEAKSRPVYVNEPLTPENKRLFAKALKLKKKKRLAVPTD